jgi:cardiolipin synthase A/B
VTSMDVVGLSQARWVTHIALMAARRRAWIANAYFVPPPEVLGALLLLPRHGVDVRLLLPGPHQDHRSVTFLQRRLYPRLERGGVRVYEYQPSMMHSKTMLVDDRLVVVGSINMDYLSMEWLEEGCLLVDDRAFAAELEQRWTDDVARSRQVTGRGEPTALATPPSPRQFRPTLASAVGPAARRSRRPGSTDPR